MYSCECNKVGGPWIAEDPNCPQHGTNAQTEAKWAAQERADNLSIRDQLKERVNDATTFDELKAIMLDMLDIT